MITITITITKYPKPNVEPTVGLKVRAPGTARCGGKIGTDIFCKELSVSKINPFIDPFVSLLLQCCGDVEMNPGPGPGHGLVGNSVSQDCQWYDDLDSAGNGDLGEQPNCDDPPTRGERCDLQVITLNVRGLTDNKKVRHLVNCCYKNSKTGKDNIFLFQETFVPTLNLLNYLWRGEYHLTPGTGNSLGCITLLCAPYKILHRVDFKTNEQSTVLPGKVEDSNHISQPVCLG